VFHKSMVETIIDPFIEHICSTEPHIRPMWLREERLSNSPFAAESTAAARVVPLRIRGEVRKGDRQMTVLKDVRDLIGRMAPDAICDDCIADRADRPARGFESGAGDELRRGRRTLSWHEPPKGWMALSAGKRSGRRSWRACRRQTGNTSHGPAAAG